MSDKPDKEKKDHFQDKLFKAIKETTGDCFMMKIPKAVMNICHDDFTTAAVLSTLIYWCDRGGNKYGIWKTHKEWRIETGLGRFAIDKATKILISNELVTREVHKAPLTIDKATKTTREVPIAWKPTVYYKLDQEKLLNLICEKQQLLISTDKEKSNRENQQIINCEKQQINITTGSSLGTKRTSNPGKKKSKPHSGNSLSGGEGIGKEKSKPKSLSGLRESFAPTRPVIEKHWAGLMKQAGYEQSLNSAEHRMLPAFMKKLGESNIPILDFLTWAVKDWSRIKLGMKKRTNMSDIEYKRADLIPLYHRRQPELEATVYTKASQVPINHPDRERLLKMLKITGKVTVNEQEQKRRVDRTKSDPDDDGL